ncbi:diguanylate cyclase domain-containing protein [Lusitaniella coriacea]|uniref:GGDEF domain-containing response regulator n=1 Tax=Lusitaniella coriacea TaxID=1983105 RepID=UPI003CEFACB1
MNSHPVNASPEQILIVEPKADAIDLLAPLLNQYGFQVQQAFTGQMALVLAQTELPDAILLDFEMPDLNGYRICERLKANPQTRDIPILLIGSKQSGWDKVKAFKIGCADCITKPFEVEEMLARIQNQLKAYSSLKLLFAQNQMLVAEIRKRQEVEQALRLSEEKFSKAFRCCPNPMTITRLSDGTHIEINETFCELTGYIPEEVVGRSAQELSLWVKGQDRDRLFKLLEQSGVVRNYEFAFRTKYGAERMALLSAEIINLRGENCLLALSHDITERVKAEEALQQANQKLQRLATVDSLTQVANRLHFDQSLRDEWCRLTKEGLPIALILCDVDYFKFYNDTYGHQAGDACLQKVARTICRALKAPNHLAARYGGEEFAIILPAIAGDEAFQIAETIRLEIERLQIPHGKSLASEFVTLSLGVASTVPKDGFSPEVLIGVADLALYEAKNQGRNCAIAETYLN